MAGNDFTLKLGADNTALLQGLQQAAQSLGGFTSAAKAAVAGLTAGFGLKTFTADFMDYHTNLSNATQVMGYSVRNVEAIGGAMRRFGGDTSGALSSLDSLTTSLQQATWGTGPLLDVAQKYGITFQKSNGQLMNAEELLGSLSKQLNTFDAQTKRAVASQLGLDAALLRVIDSGNYDSMIAQQRALGLSTEEDLKLATEMESAWLDLKDSFTQVARELSRALVPHLTRLMRSLHSVMQSTAGLRQMAVEAFKKILVVAEPLAGPIAAIAAGFVAMQTASKSLALIKTGFSALVPVVTKLMSPFRVMSLLFGALLLVMEDIYVYSQGGDSLFGELMKAFPGLEEGIKAVIDTVAAVFDKVKEGYDWVSSLTWNDFITAFDNAFIAIQRGFASIINWIVEQINTYLIGTINSTIETVEDLPGLGWAKGFKFKELEKMKLAEYKPFAPAETSTSGGGTVIDNSQKQTSNNFYIKSTDPEGAAREISETLKMQGKVNQSS